MTKLIVIFIIAVFLIAVSLNAKIHLNIDELSKIQITSISIDKSVNFEFRTMEVNIQKQSGLLKTLKIIFPVIKYKISDCTPMSTKHQCFKIFNKHFGKTGDKNKKTYKNILKEFSP